MDGISRIEEQLAPVAWRRRQIGLLALAVLAEAGCTVTYPPPPVISPQQPPGLGGAIEPALPMQSAALSLDGYKRDVAKHIYRVNAESLFDGPPPPTLRSIVVLSLNVDANGTPNAVALLRSNGFTELEGVAIRSVRRASPLPAPPALIARNGRVEFVETWLFRQDGKFQIRSLAEIQQDASADASRRPGDSSSHRTCCAARIRHRQALAGFIHAIFKGASQWFLKSSATHRFGCGRFSPC